MERLVRSHKTTVNPKQLLLLLHMEIMDFEMATMANKNTDTNSDCDASHPSDL